MRDMTPGDYPNAFGFDYERWEARSTIKLLNVPWSADYQDVVVFDDRNTQAEYFYGVTGRAHTIVNTTYCRPGERVRINVPFHDAYKYNYLMVDQRQKSVGEAPRLMYYFIQDVRHIAPNTTELIVMLDVWQTFMFDVTLGRAYIEQGHVGIAQQGNHADYGREYLMEPEGFELGAEMVTLSSSNKTIGTATPNRDQGSSYDIIVWSNTQLWSNWGYQSNPNMRMATGTSMSGMPQAMDCYLFDGSSGTSSFMDFMVAVSDAPWVAQGITSIQVIPNGVMTNVQTSIEEFELWSDVGNTKIQSGKIKKVDSFSGSVKDIAIDKDFRSHMREYMGTRYRNLNKFLTAPYSMVEVTTYTGAPLMLRPECVKSSGIIVRRYADLGLPSPRIVIQPLQYNARTTKISETIDPGRGYLDSVAEEIFNKEESDFLDVQTGIYNMPTLSILNNSYLAYMSSNAHSIAYQHSNADWSQQKALTGNQLSFDQSSAGIALNSEMNRIGNQQAIVGGAIGAVGSVAGVGAAETYNAGPGPQASAHQVAASNAARSLNRASAVMGMASNAANTANSVYHNNARTGAQNSNSSYMRDSNKAYADFAAKGDYAQSIAGINAKAQDMKAVAPTTIGQVGGETFAFQYTQWRIFAKVKMIQPANLRSIGEYWLRYGYKINRPMNFGGAITKLSVMSKFTYWRMSEVYLRAGSCPENYRMSIRGILTKGVTVWNNPNDLGMIDPATNDPIVANYYI